MPGRGGGTTGQIRAMEEPVERNMHEPADFAVQYFEEQAHPPHFNRRNG